MVPSIYHTWYYTTLLGQPSRDLNRVLASRVSGCLLNSMVYEKYLILGKNGMFFLEILIPS